MWEYEIPEAFQRYISSMQPNSNIIQRREQIFILSFTIPVSHAYSADSGANIKKQEPCGNLEI